jgi:calmodulin
LEENFKLYDKDENGRLSVKEAGTMWRSLGANPTEAEIQEMFDAIDADGRFNIELQFIIISEY